MNTSFLDYYKMILEKVSFDKALFIKEYGKALRGLQPSEIDKLNAWVKGKGLVDVQSLTRWERSRRDREPISYPAPERSGRIR